MPRAEQNYTKAITVSERKLRIKAMLPWTFLLILLTLGVMAKQRLLHENQIGQCFQN